MTIIPVLMIIGGFLLLIKGADFLVSGASSLAKRFNVSDLTIGLTIVAMGTSAPELLVNILSGHQSKTDLVFGNIIGSNIFNLFLILGTASIIFPMSVQRSILRKDVPYCTLGLILLLFLVNDHWFFPGQANGLGTWDCIILLSVFVIFLMHTFINLRKGSNTDINEEEIITYSSSKSIVFIVLGIVGLSFGGDLVVNGAVDLALKFEIDEKIIGLTILAAGTSLPELATSCVAALNRKSDLAVGNIIGSNIFNTLMVLPLTGLITSSKGALHYDAHILNTDMYITIAGMLMVVAFMFTFRRSKIDRSEGAILLLCFFAYAYLIYTRL